MIVRRNIAAQFTVSLAMALALAVPHPAMAADHGRASAKGCKFFGTRAGVVTASVLAGAIGTLAAVSERDKCLRNPAEPVSKTVDQAERAVESAPRDATLRATLGRAYLKEGRVVSAVTTLSDAVTLGDTSNRTMLSLALAQIANGQNREAVQTLDQGRDVIPVADLGLALALAGESGRGATVLGDALRGGDKSDKLRANLAYAYALDGRWAEARNLVSLDLPANEVDQRMTEWAKAATPEASRERVATLLGVTFKSDGGLPHHLALAPALDGGARMAANDTAPAQPALAAAPQPVAPDELPAVAPEAAPAVAEPASPAPVQWATVEPAGGPAPLAAEPAAPVVPQFHAVAVKGAKPLKIARHKPVREPKPVAAPVEAPVEMAVADVAPADATPAKTPARAAGKGVKPARVAMAHTSGGGAHSVQLGAFLSEKNAERARKLALGRDKGLSADAVTITKAEVDGKTFWRVSVAGLDAAAASGKCAAIRKSGGACFARADGAAKASAPRLAVKQPKAMALVATVKAVSAGKR